MSLEGLRFVGTVGRTRHRKVGFYFCESPVFLKDLYSLRSERHTKHYVGTGCLAQGA
jgi:hypothetical protein